MGVVERALNNLDSTHFMGWFKRDREKDRFYLLPGMGGKAYVRKRNIILAWSIIAGLLVSGVFAWMLYYVSQR